MVDICVVNSYNTDVFLGFSFLCERKHIMNEYRILVKY